MPRGPAFFACLLAVLAYADDTVCECTSERSQVETLNQQVAELTKKLEAAEKAKTSGSEQVAELTKKLETTEKAHVGKVAELTKKVEAAEKKADAAGKASETATANANGQLSELAAKLDAVEKAKLELSNKLKDADVATRQSSDQIAELSEKLLAAERSSDEGQQISMMDLASKFGGITKDMVQHGLKKTDLDERIMHTVGTKAVAAKQKAGALANDIKTRIASVDYAGIAKSVSSKVSENGSVGPLVEKARAKLEPAIEKLAPVIAKAGEMAGPALEKAQPVLQVVGDKAKVVYAKGVQAVQEHVVPVLMEGGSQAFERASDAGYQRLEKLMSPIFDFVQQAAPEYHQTLPSHPVDRALFLVMMIVVAYYTLYFTRLTLRIALRLVGRTSLVTLRLFRLLVVLPLKIVLKLIETLWWVATLFYCCGLCRRKKKAADLKAKAKVAKGSTDKNGDKNAKEDVANAPKVTVEECKKLLDATKKKGKLDAGVQQLGKFVKSGKPLEQKEVKGKVLTKEVFASACKTFGVDAPKNL